MLIQPGDLPARYVCGQVQDVLPGMFGDIPRAMNQIYQQFDLYNSSGGGVSVIVYDSTASSIAAFGTILMGMRDEVQKKDIK